MCRVGVHYQQGYSQPTSAPACLGLVPLGFEYHDSFAVGYHAPCLLVLLHRPPYNVVNRQRLLLPCRCFLFLSLGSTSAPKIAQGFQFTRFGTVSSKRRTRYERMTAYPTKSFCWFLCPFSLRTFFGTVQYILFPFFQ